MLEVRLMFRCYRGRPRTGRRAKMDGMILGLAQLIADQIPQTELVEATTDMAGDVNNLIPLEPPVWRWYREKRRQEAIDKSRAHQENIRNASRGNVRPPP